MEDRVYQDPFDLDFPDVSDSEDLLEAKDKLNEEVKTFVEELLPALEKASFVPRDGKLSTLDTNFLDTLGGRGYAVEDKYRIKFWKQCHLVACPTLESGALSSVKVLGSGDPVSLKTVASKAWQKETHKALIQAIPLPKQFKGAFFSNKFPVPAFVCVDPKDCISQELYDEIKKNTKLPRLKDFGSVFAASSLKNAIVIGCYFLEAKEPVLRLAIEVRSAFCNGLSPELINSPGARREPKQDDPLKGTDPGNPVTEDEVGVEAEDEEVPDSSSEEISDDSDFSEFDNEELRTTLRNIGIRFALKDKVGLTDTQIERLYKSGIIQAIAELNLDDIEEEGE